MNFSRLKAQIPYPAFICQQDWVIQSASADQGHLIPPCIDGLKAWAIVKAGIEYLKNKEDSCSDEYWRSVLRENNDNILIYRHFNIYSPELIEQTVPKRFTRPSKSKIAIILTGELRCIEKSRELIKSLANYVDLFIATTYDFSNISLGQKLCLTVEDDANLQIGSMQQWHKLSKGLEAVRNYEIENKKRYTHIMKLRSDYHFIDPRDLLKDLVDSEGILCSSDKIFGGSRDLMFLFYGFPKLILSVFNNNECRYWPINIDHILMSDDSFKWYGMNFPVELVGNPSTVSELRYILSRQYSEIGSSLLTWIPKDPDTPEFSKLFIGHKYFASEICFARFLNFNAIPVTFKKSIAGFLRHDR